MWTVHSILLVELYKIILLCKRKPKITAGSTSRSKGKAGPFKGQGAAYFSLDNNMPTGIELLFKKSHDQRC